MQIREKDINQQRAKALEETTVHTLANQAYAEDITTEILNCTYLSCGLSSSASTFLKVLRLSCCLHTFQNFGETVRLRRSVTSGSFEDHRNFWQSGTLFCSSHRNYTNITQSFQFWLCSQQQKQKMECRTLKFENMLTNKNPPTKPNQLLPVAYTCMQIRAKRF